MFPRLACSLYLEFISIPLLLCFILTTFGHRYHHISGQIVSGLDVTCVVVNLPSTRE